MLHSIDLSERLRRALRDVPDFPKPGILFKDITPALADPGLLPALIEALADPFRQAGITHVVGIESRGFILGAPVAIALGAGFVPVRKPGKLPHVTRRESYDLEYGRDGVEIHEDACREGSRVLVVDDVLATGGTAAATCRLVRSLGAEIAGCSFLLRIATLEGERSLGGVVTRTLLSV